MMDETTEISIPRVDTVTQAHRRLAELATQLRAATGMVVFDWSGCTFFAAHWCAVLSGLLSMSESHHGRVEMAGIRPTVRKILQRNGFLSDFGYDELDDGYGTTIPYRQYGLTERNQFLHDLRHHYVGKISFPRVTDGVADRLTRSLLEIFVNCEIHSQSAPGVYVCGQYFRQRHELCLVIYDIGTGIPATVREHLGESVADGDAITWAMVHGNTTKSSVTGGLGLSLLEEFVRRNGGQLAVLSGCGSYLLRQGHLISDTTAFALPGTCICITVRTDDSAVYTLKEEIDDRDIF